MARIVTGAGAAVAAAITLAGRARGATGPMTEEVDPDLSATLLFLGAVAAAVAMPLLAFRLPPGARRVALAAGLGVGSGFFTWSAAQPINAGSEWLLLIGAGLAIGDAGLLLFAPRVASLLAVLAALAAVLLTPLPAHLMARAFASVGSGGAAVFSTWILFAWVYAQIVFGVGVLVSSPARPAQGEAEARAHMA